MAGSAERRPTEERCDLPSRIAKTMRDAHNRGLTISRLAHADTFGGVPRLRSG